MTQAQNTAPKFVAAPVTTEIGKAAIAAIVKASTAHIGANDKAQAAFEKAKAKADESYLEGMINAAKVIGMPITEEQWNRQLSAAVTKAVTAKVAAASVSGYVSRAKTVTLAYLAGKPEDASHFGKPLMGEKANAYLERVRPLMGEAKLPEGAWLITRNADGTPKAKAGAQAGKKKVTPPSNSAGKAEGGSMAAAAKILMNGSDDAAKTLLKVLAEHRAEFDKWAADTLARAAEADAAAAAKEATNKAIFTAVDSKAA